MNYNWEIQNRGGLPTGWGIEDVFYSRGRYALISGRHSIVVSGLSQSKRMKWTNGVKRRTEKVNEKKRGDIL
jgi:hypothetical protein